MSIQFIDLKKQQQILGEKINKSILRVLEHGQYIMGPEVKELEQKLSEFSGAKHSISCASGTDALLLALMVHDIHPGDAVFVPSFTFVSTAEVVVLLGGTPIFVDVDRDYFLMNSENLKQAMILARKNNLNARGIIPVDLFGQPADYQSINQIAAEEKLFVIADAAQSFGGERGGKKVGTMAEISATSFFPAKPLGCYGDGGALFTDDENIANKIKSMRVHGKGTDKYDNVNIGINGRLDTLQAAILIEKLSIFGDEITKRNRAANLYNSGLNGHIKTPPVAENAISVWAQYTIQTPEREQLAAKLKEGGIPTAVYYPKPLHQQTAYKKYLLPGQELRISEKLSSEVLSLPMHPYLNHDTQNHIINCILK